MITQPINIPQIAAPAVTKDGSKFNNVASSIANIFSSAAPIVQAVIPNKGINPSAPAPYYALPSSSATQAAAPLVPQKKSNTLLYAGIAAGIALLGFVGYKVATGKKKGVNGIGCPEPAKPATVLSGVKKSRKRKKSKKVKNVRI